MSVTVTAPATFTTTVTSNAAATTIASASTTGTAKFNTDNFAVSGAGDVTIKNAGVLLTAEVTGTLPIANGGTGATSAAMVGIITAANASAARTVLELGTAALVATGTGDANAILGNDARLTDARTPSSTLDHSTDKLTSGTLPVGRGGTGLTAVTTLLNSNQAYSDISGTPTLGTAAALAVGISNTNVLQANAVVADDDFLRIDGTTVEGRSAAETLSDIGAAAASHNQSAATITSGTLAVARGGTGVTSLPMVTIPGAADAAAARVVLGVTNVGSYTGQIETVADKTYTLDPGAATARTISGFFIKSASGTVTAALKVGTAVVKSASVTDSTGDQTSLANTGVSANDVLTLVCSSNSSALDVIFAVEFTE